VPGPQILGRIDFDEAFSLSQSICSYGYVGLAPNQWFPAPATVLDDDVGEFERPLVYGTQHHEERCVIVRFRQVGGCVEIVVVGGDCPSTVTGIAQVSGATRCQTVACNYTCL
jgi:hypothetical protein